MENILQKTVVAVLLIYLSYVACSQTADEEQGTQAPETCNTGHLFAGTGVNEGVILSSVHAYEDDQASVTIENASLPLNTITPSSFRVRKDQTSIDIIPQVGGVLLVPSIRDLSSNIESVFVRSPVYCVFTGFHALSDVNRDSVLGSCVNSTYFNPLTISLDFTNLSNSRIFFLRRNFHNHNPDILYGPFSNFVSVRNRRNGCLPGDPEFAHILYIDDGFIINFNIEDGMYSATDVTTCDGESQLELVSPNKLAAYCNSGATLITICDINFDNGDSSRYSTSFTRSEWGEVYFCSETVFVSAKNDTLTLHSVSDRQEIGNSTDFLSDEINHAVCRVSDDDVFNFVATLENGETWYCNLSDNYCQLLGMSEHAMNVSSMLVGGQYVIVNDDTHTLLYDLLCQANPVVARLSRNFDFANFYPAPLHVSCQCSQPTTTESLETDGTTTEPTTDTPTTTDQPTTTESLETDGTTTELNVVPPKDSSILQPEIIVAVVTSVNVVIVVLSVAVLTATCVFICRRRQRRARNYGVNGVVDHELRPLGAGNGSVGDSPEPAEPSGNGKPQQPSDSGGELQQPSDSGSELQQPSDSSGESEQPSDIGEPQQPSDSGGESEQPSDIGEPQQPSDSVGRRSLHDEHRVTCLHVAATTGHDNNLYAHALLTFPPSQSLVPSAGAEQPNSNAAQYSERVGHVVQIVNPEYPTNHDRDRQCMVVPRSNIPLDANAIIEHEEQTADDRADTHLRVVTERNNREQYPQYPDNERNC